MTVWLSNRDQVLLHIQYNSRNGQMIQEWQFSFVQMEKNDAYHFVKWKDLKKKIIQNKVVRAQQNWVFGFSWVNHVQVNGEIKCGGSGYIF